MGCDHYRNPTEKYHQYGATNYVLIPIYSTFWESFSDNKICKRFVQGLARLPSHLSTAHSHFTLDREEQEWIEPSSRVQIQKRNYLRIMALHTIRKLLNSFITASNRWQYRKDTFCRAPVKSVVDSTPYSRITEEMVQDIVTLYRCPNCIRLSEDLNVTTISGTTWRCLLILPCQDSPDQGDSEHPPSSKRIQDWGVRLLASISISLANVLHPESPTKKKRTLSFYHDSWTHNSSFITVLLALSLWGRTTITFFLLASVICCTLLW